MTTQSNPARAPRRTWLVTATAALVLSCAAVAVTEQTRATSAARQQQLHSGGATTTAPRAQPTTTAAGIKNFGKVNDNYYRGAQPLAEGFAELKQMGVKTVIDLRQDSKRGAAEWARAAGLNYINLPLVASRPATDEETQEFLRLVNDPANWPVYVHCKGGRHRTGALTAVFRMTHDGWTADQAFQEMLDYDFDNGSFLGGGGGRARQKKYVYDFYARRTAGATTAGRQ